MQKVTILKGLPASGKSTWAKEQVASEQKTKRVNKDDLRAMLDNSKWSKGNEKFVLFLRDNIIVNALREGYNIIVDDTNFHPKHEENIRELIRVFAINHRRNVEVGVKEFTTDVYECIKRDAKREKPVGAKVIHDMYNQFLKPDIIPYKAPEGVPEAIIVDVDGTLAHMVDRGAFDWHKVKNDILDQYVANIVRSYASQDYEIIVVTGRDGVCEEDTKQWLLDNRIHFDRFFIRPAGNNEKDAIIKRRIFDEHIRDQYNILFVLDDRDQVVRMWRDIGLKCLQVAEGDF